MGMGIEGVLWAAPISDMIALIITFILVFLEFKKLDKNKNFASEPSYNLAK
jgi:Na+-driven multidrug efflux pump